jgi:hypothetical protein
MHGINAVRVISLPGLFLTPAQKYMFRNSGLQRLRIEQVTRYFATSAGTAREAEAAENTIADDDIAVDVDTGHRHYDSNMEAIPVGTKYPSLVKGLETLSRRRQARLGVTRCAYSEPLAGRREKFFEQERIFS